MSLELSCLDKVWILKDSDIEAVRLLSEKLDISPVTATVLVNRGVKNVSEAEAFLNPSLSSISAPDLLPHAAMAAEIVGEAVVNKKRIVIYGDYDVDGITGTALLFSFLKNIAGDVAFYIPNRLKEGYGLNQDAIKHLKSQSAELIVTVDCGISNLNEVALAAQLGIQVIITDHHEPPPELPSASAIVNPKLK
ncbi:MAG TPA: DHH family phosphoesterase, partial [bacterium]